MKRLFSLLMCVIILNTIIADDSPFVKQPSLNSDGSVLAFSYQGDIWTVPTTGGTASRLTIHEGYDGFPKWSPDNKKIAFNSNRFGTVGRFSPYGGNDVFIIDAKGGNLKRLTYYSTANDLGDWTPDGNLTFTTRREYRQIEWTNEIYEVSSKGGTPYRIMDGFGNMPVTSPDNKFVAYVRGSCRLTREAYKGPANREIWLFNKDDKSYKQLTKFDGMDIYPVWGDSKTIYYLSAKSGRYNVYKMQIDDSGNVVGNDEQLTKYSDEGITYLSISADGSTLAFEYETDIYVMKTNGGEAKKVNITVAKDDRFDPVEYRTFSGSASEYDVSPNGKYTAFVTRGEIFIKENDKEKSRSINLSNHSFRDHQISWLSDTSLVFVSDRDGQFDLYLLKSADKDQSNLFKSMKHEVKRITSTQEDESYPVVSPDSKKINYQIERGKLIVAEISADGDLSNSVTLLDGWDTPANVNWSPDSKWLAYSLENLEHNTEIFIHSADGKKDPVNVSMHPRIDYNPVWSPDGSKLGFYSDRNNRTNDIWFAWLNKKDWEKTQRDWDEGDDEEKPKKDKKKDDDKDEVEPIKIDLDGIHERLVQVTNLGGSETNLAFSKDGETVYYTALNPTKSGTDLYKSKWNGEDKKQITKSAQSPGGLLLSKDGKYLYFIKRGGKLSRIATSSDKEEGMSFSAKMTVDYYKEKEQMFEEGWRLLRDGFYDPNYHGQDWNALKAKYKPRALKTTTGEDFRNVFRTMIGQMNASHMNIYATADTREDLNNHRTGRLGIEVAPEGDAVVVKHVTLDSPADKKRSKLNVGDKIVSVNGTKLNSSINFNSLLVNTTNEKVLLEVEDKNGNKREVVIRPVSSLTSNLNEEWAKEKRALVEKYSNGRLGYLHVRTMGWTNYEKFERELTAAGYGKEGLVIDVRNNNGGWITDFLMTSLNVDQHAFTIPRGAAKNLEKEHKNFVNYYPYGERLPYGVWTKPSIALCNENSYSNAEIFSHAYKNLGIGKLVGNPTFGAVISTGGRSMIDGTWVRLPYRGWFVKKDLKNMDFYPAVPDIIVDNAPDYRRNGEDTQLKTAVEELLKELD